MNAGGDDNFTFEKLRAIVDELGPVPPRPVIIVAKWWIGSDALRREKDGCDEWRITAAMFDALTRDAVWAPGNPYSEPLDSVEVLQEDWPPLDLIEQMFGPQRPFTADLNRRFSCANVAPSQ